MRRWMVAVLAVASVCLAVGGVGAAEGDSEKPVGKIKLTAESVAVGVGYSWGSGVLTFGGKEYKFKVTGLSAGATVGASRMEAVGDVYYLKKLSDFNGNYTSFSAGATIGGGGGIIKMRNQNGVHLSLQGTTQGLKLTVAADGLKIQIE